MKFKKILVPIDFSESSIEALEVALEHFHDAKIYVFTAADIQSSSGLSANIDTQFKSSDQDAVYRRLKSIIADHADRSSDMEPALGVGKPVKAILEAAEHYEVGLIMISSHGDTSVAKNLFGHTTYQVSRKAPCSVWVIKGRSFHKRPE